MPCNIEAKAEPNASQTGTSLAVKAGENALKHEH
jgi:hypothetical protein